MRVADKSVYHYTIPYLFLFIMVFMVIMFLWVIVIKAIKVDIWNFIFSSFGEINGWGGGSQKLF